MKDEETASQLCFLELLSGQEPLSKGDFSEINENGIWPNVN